MSDFAKFAFLIHARFVALSKHELFVTIPDGDAVWTNYLSAFPAGTNPIFRERTDHDCSCCRNFIKHIGNVVAIIDGKPQSVWAVEGAEYPYNEVAKVLDALVTQHSITSLFRTKERRYGADYNFEGDHKWHHFHGHIADKHFTRTPAKACGDYATTVSVFKRGLVELTPGSFQTVIDLIQGKALYRGEEFLAAIKGFQKLQREYLAIMDPDARHQFAWVNATDPATRFRNTAIGTLIQDLSEGMDLERAVRSFEQKVAPTNYKRPTALITPRMVEDAMKTITDLGLEPALERRFAKLSDVSVNNVLWVDNSVQGQMKDGIAGLLMDSAVSVTNNTKAKATDISIEDFMAQVAPKAKTIEAFVASTLQSNFMSLTAPVHPDPAHLFKWDNDFAWSYDGNITDSDLRQQVAALGGRVDGVFRFSHTWNYRERNASLMDLHVFLPGHNGTHENRIRDAHSTYGNTERVGWDHRKHARTLGDQDVDYVNAAPTGHAPVENITFPNMDKLPDGPYTCMIHNWNLRKPTEGGFKAEIEFGGQVFEYEVTRPLKHKEWVKVATVTKKNGAFSIEHHLPCGSASQEKWGILTETYAKVNTLVQSPNHWDDNAVGNKHWFFILDKCLNDQPARGIYNEFLNPRLEQHRKVFEVLGNKTKCQPTDEQLSGLGFSSTRGDSVVVRVTGDIRGTYNIQF